MLAGEAQVLASKARLQRLDERVQQEGVVVEVGREARLAGFPGRVQRRRPARRSHAGSRGRRARRRRDAAHRAAARRWRGPGSSARSRRSGPCRRVRDARAARVRRGASRGPRRAGRRRRRGVSPSCSATASIATKACRCQAPSKFGSRSSPKRRASTRYSSGVEQALDLVALPHVEAALVALGIRVERRVEAAIRRAHLARAPMPRSRARRRAGPCRPSRRRPVRTARAAGHCRRASSRSAESSRTGPPSSGRIRRRAGRRSRPRPCGAASGRPSSAFRPQVRAAAARWTRHAGTSAPGRSRRSADRSSRPRLRQRRARCGSRVTAAPGYGAGGSRSANTPRSAAF